MQMLKPVASSQRHSGKGRKLMQKDVVRESQTFITLEVQILTKKTPQNTAKVTDNHHFECVTIPPEGVDVRGRAPPPPSSLLIHTFTDISGKVGCSSVRFVSHGRRALSADRDSVDSFWSH